ncbi:MAG: NUDIX hydrolase [Candidatus Adiutricales bacterium]
MKPLYTDGKKKNGLKKPLDAATVILARENTDQDFEIFLMRRHRNQSFMGSAYVFPGGRLDKADTGRQLTAYSQGLAAEEAAARLNERDLDHDLALGLFFAAIRETFEEAGVLLAVPASGGVLDFKDQETGSRFEAYRRKIHDQEMTLKDLAEEEELVYALDLLTPYSHWITPDIESKRFDTRFLLARMPKNQAPIHDSIEMTESLWVSPAKALAGFEAGEILLMPPTLKTIEELAEFSSLGHLFASASTKEIYPILPQGEAGPDGVILKLPIDPEYSIEGYKQPARPEEKTRIVNINGKWRTMRAGGDDTASP